MRERKTATHDLGAVSLISSSVRSSWVVAEAGSTSLRLQLATADFVSLVPGLREAQRLRVAA